jgi:Circularly permutated YpsA SLOG family
MRLERIVSGGQTGVDRAALDVALDLGIACGGWCPRGRLAEDGVIPPRYALTETASARYEERTERNVRDADATLILARRPLSGGTALTERLADRHRKPVLVVDPADLERVADVALWLGELAVRVLNVAGPRASTVPQAHHQAAHFLRRLLDVLVAADPARRD